MPPRTLLFVYGLLRPGAAPLEVRPWLKKATDLGQATVAGELYDLGSYPAALSGDGVIHGRLLDVPDEAALWQRLDAYEGCDAEPPLYRRERVTVIHESGKTHDAWIYWYARSLPATARRVVDGCWRPMIR